MLEALLDPEAVAQRGGDQAGAGGRADQRERRQGQRDDPGTGALPDRDRQGAVLHGRIERLLERARQAVDLVHEEHRAGLERGQEGGHVALALERRAGRLYERNPELGGHDLGQRGLAQARRPGEQDMVERLAAAARRRDRHRELVLDRLLADEVLQAAGAQRAVEVVVGQHLRDPGSAAAGRRESRAPGSSRRPRGLHRRAILSAWAIRSSGRSPSAPSSSSSTSSGV